VSHGDAGVCVGLSSLAIRELFSAREIHEAMHAHCVMFEYALARCVSRAFLTHGLTT
jgi:hypothetical protein